MPTRLFLSYARADGERFARKLHAALVAAGFDVWFDRVSMPSRQLSFSTEIQAAISACDRLVLILTPGATSSDYVSQEWRFALQEAFKGVNPLLHIGDYSLLPESLRDLHT